MAGCTKIVAHQYPGPPSCGSELDLAAYDIQSVSSEYLSIIDTPGTVTIRDEATFGCNGYSAANVAYNLANADEVLVTLSGDQTGLAQWVSSPGVIDTAKIATEVATIVSFVNSNNLHGMNIDIEGFSGWSVDENDAYIEFLNQLGVELHKTCKKLRVYFPAMWTQVVGSPFVWRPIDIEAAYNNFSYAAVVTGAGANIDEYEIGSYDFMFDFVVGYAGEQGTGSNIAPVQTQTWLSDVIDYAIGQIGTQKLAIGIANYGYTSPINAYPISIQTFNQISAQPGFAGAVRDAESQELQWTNGGNQFSYADQVTLDARMVLVQSKGVKNVMVWHLGGGNPWFTENYRDDCNPTVAVTKTDAVDPVNVGDTVNWTVTVAAGADGDLRDVDVNDTIPANYTSPEYSCDGTTWFPWTGSLTFPGSINSDVTNTIYFRAVANTPGTPTNTVNVDSDAGAVTGSASEPTTINSTTDPVITVGVTDSPDPVVTPNVVTYTVQINETNGFDANGVMLTATMDGSLSGLQFSTDGGTTYNPLSGAISLGTILANGSATVLIQGTTSTTGVLNNTFDVTGINFTAASDTELTTVNSTGSSVSGWDCCR